MTTPTASYGSGRYLASLKWDGVTPDSEGMFIVSRDANTRVIQDLEVLCAKDDRYDWKYAEDVAA